MTKTLQIILTAVCCFFMLSPSAENVEREDFPAIVTIHLPYGQATAFFIAPDRVVTNFHVIANMENADSASIESPSGDRIPIEEVLALDGINDLAVLKVKDYISEDYYTVEENTELYNENIIEHQRKKIFRSEDLALSGFPLGHFLYENVKLKYIYQNHIYFSSIGFLPGASGGPLFKDNKLIGVYHSGFDPFSKKTGIAVSVNILKELLSQPFLHCQYARSCIEKEIQRVQLSAEKGDANAQKSLGYMYLTGQSYYPLEADQEKALYWIKKSAEQNYIYNYFVIYRHNRGWKDSPSSLYRLFRTSIQAIFEALKQEIEIQKKKL